MSDYTNAPYQPGTNTLADYCKQLEKELAEEKAKSQKLAQALEYYAPANSYDYDKVQGLNYIFNDQGKTARQALREYKGEK